MTLPVRRALGRRAAAMGAVVLLTSFTLAPATPARASGTAGYCPDADGVTVVVDFQQLGGSTLVRCAPGTPATGLAALKSAGFTVTGTIRWGEAFICRIEGLPGADQESCVDTPPTSAYWSYWYAGNGGDWTYAQQGASGRAPVAGGFEGWSFSLDRAGTTAPPPRVAPRRPAPDPPPTSAAPPANPGGGRPAPPSGDSSGSDSSGRAPTDQGTATDRQPHRGPLDRPAPTLPQPTPVATPTSTPPTAGRPPPGGATNGVPTAAVSELLSDTAATRGTGSGVPVGTLVGLGLLLALMVAAVVTVRRRRSATGDG